METYDGVLLGTGHNTLVLQAYLSRCGLKTVALDRAQVPGGGLSTLENPRVPGVRYNPHSFFHRAITGMPWYRDLDLEAQGVRYLEPELNVALLLKDGSSLQWWTDLERTAESFARFSARDADALRRWGHEFRPILEHILVPEAQSAPLEAGRRRRVLGRSSLGRRLLEVSALSPLEFVTREFEHDVIRAGLLFFNGLREVDLRLPGFGHAIPALLASSSKAQMCVGGAANLARGLVKEIEEHGGEIRCGVTVRRIVMEKGRASGVELEDGEIIRADGFVASGLNPQQTFLQLLPESDVAEELRKQAKGFRYNLLAPLFGLHLALVEPPRYHAARLDPELDRAFMVILGLEKFEQFPEIVAAHERGQIPSPVAWGACPTRFDPWHGDGGLHSAFLWEKLPYSLNGNPQNWKAERDLHGDTLFEFWREYASNLEPDTVLDRFALSPLDTETTLPNMAQGDLLVGSFGKGQLGYNRPFAGAGRYRTPLPGLYLCGGSTHPGGNITGLCGYNAASVIAADVGKPVWWSTHDLESQLDSLD